MNDGLAGMLLQADAAPFDPSFFLMMGSVFLIFYLLVIRPESTKRKQHEAAIKAAQKGDQVVTSGGIQGVITGSTDDIVTIEIAALKSGERVRVKVQRSGLTSITTAADKSDDKSGKKGGDS
ncbi:MAG: preprotein translocase subunit YajC [Myxococcota bacterium]|nr:preprotein translocase subunit YajC [Myxococcota bacterium]